MTMGIGRPPIRRSLALPDKCKPPTFGLQVDEARGQVFAVASRLLVTPRCRIRMLPA